MDYVIGADIGSQSVKAILLSVEGEYVGEDSQEYPIDYPHPLWAEQPVERWTNALTRAVRRLIQKTHVNSNNIRALALATQVDGVVPVDSSGEALHPGIIWMDRRAEAQLQGVEKPPGAARAFALTGLNLDATHVAPKIRWLMETHPEVASRTQSYLLPGSYMACFLTREIAVDYSNASSTLLLDVRTRNWSAEMCAAFGIDASQLAPVYAATAPVGSLRPPIAEAMGLSLNTRVMVGCGDEHAACLGAGVVRPGLVGDIAGTAEPVGVVSAHPVFDPTRLLETHCHADPDVWLLENPGFVSGGNLRWYREQFAHLEMQAATEQNTSPYRLLDEKAALIPPGSEGVIFLPTLMGAMAPTWNTSARGTFFGFTLAHTRDHFFRAVLEGSAYAVRDNTDQMQAIGLQLEEIRVVGGGSKSPLWNQIKADVTGLPVAVPKITETTALGAAFLALVGFGVYASLTEASEHMVRIAHRLEPNLETQARYQEAYQQYRRLYFSLLPVFEKVSQN